MELSEEHLEKIEKEAKMFCQQNGIKYPKSYYPGTKIVVKHLIKFILSDPELLSKAGWVKKEEWISAEDKLPEVGQNVLIRYYKHKKSNFSGNTGVFIIQAYYLEQNHYNFNNELLYVEKCWYDYTDRKIWDINSESKNKVIEWQPLPSPPQNKEHDTI